MNVHLVAQKSCSDAAMTFWKEASISRLNLNPSKVGRLRMIWNLSIIRGGRRCSSDSECFGTFWRACSTLVNWNTAYLDWYYRSGNLPYGRNSLAKASTSHFSLSPRRLKALGPVASSRAKISVSVEFSQCACKGTVLFEAPLGLSRPGEISVRARVSKNLISVHPVLCQEKQLYWYSFRDTEVLPWCSFRGLAGTQYESLGPHQPMKWTSKTHALRCHSQSWSEKFS